jgi:hypothetical protein
MRRSTNALSIEARIADPRERRCVRLGNGKDEAHCDAVMR